VTVRASRWLAAPLVLIAIATWPQGAHAHARSAPFGFAGVDYDRDVSWAPPETQAAMWSAMARNGVESARAVFDWSEAQKLPGTAPDFHETDPLVANAATHGIELLPTVMYAPPWARVAPDRKESAPSDYSAYAAYLRALVERYGPSGSFWAERADVPRRPIGAWQVWNEPDMKSQWSPRDDWEHHYGQLLDAARSALRAADPGARLVLASLTNSSWTTLDALYAGAGIGGDFDAVALNAYTREAGNLVGIVRRGRAAMAAHGDGKLPILVTEFGASASKGRIAAPGQEHLQVSDKQLAKLVGRMYGALAKRRKELGVTHAYWYTWASSYDPHAGGIFDFSGLVQYPADGFSARPALAAYRAAARRLQGCKKGAAGACLP
jgi:hypothetical protein